MIWKKINQINETKENDEEDIYEGICRLVDDPIEAEIPESSWEDSSRRMKKIYRDAASEM